MKKSDFEAVIAASPDIDTFAVTRNTDSQITYTRSDETCYASFSVIETKEGFTIRFHTTDHNRIKAFDVGGTLRGRTPEDLGKAMQVVSQGLALLQAGPA